MKAIARIEVNNKATATSLDTLSARWLSFVDVRAKSRATYQIAIRQLLKYFAAHAVVAPERADIIAYRESLKAAGKAATTINLYLSAARCFFQWLASERLYSDITVRVKGCTVRAAHKKDALTAGGAKTLLASVTGDTLKAARDRALLTLTVTAGLRTIELARAKVGDLVSRGGKTYLAVQGKGRDDKSDLVLVSRQASARLADYLQKRGALTPEAPLFASCSRRNDGCSLTPQSVSRVISTALKDSGMKSTRLTAHSLRHTAATLALKAGAQLMQVQQMLRHTSITTTMIYVHALEREQNTAEQLVADAIFS